MEFVLVTVARGANRVSAYDPRTRRSVLAVLENGRMEAYREAKETVSAFDREYIGANGNFKVLPPEDLYNRYLAAEKAVEDFETYLTYYAAKALKWHEGDTVLLLCRDAKDIEGAEMLPEFSALPVAPLKAEITDAKDLKRETAAFDVWLWLDGDAAASQYTATISDPAAISSLRSLARLCADGSYVFEYTVSAEKERRVKKAIWEYFIKPTIDNLASPLRAEYMDWHCLRTVKEIGYFEIRLRQSGMRCEYHTYLESEGDLCEYDPDALKRDRRELGEIEPERSVSRLAGYTGRDFELLKKAARTPSVMTEEEAEELKERVYDLHVKGDFLCHYTGVGLSEAIDNYEFEIVSVKEITEDLYLAGLYMKRQRVAGKAQREARA